MEHGPALPDTLPPSLGPQGTAAALASAGAGAGAEGEADEELPVVMAIRKPGHDVQTRAVHSYAYVPCG